MLSSGSTKEGYGLSSFPIDMLRCPRTRSRLTIGEGALVAANGGHRYPVINGIPDFRLFDPPYVSRAEEARRVDLLEAGFPRDELRCFGPILRNGNRRECLDEKTRGAHAAPAYLAREGAAAAATSTSRGAFRPVRDRRNQDLTSAAVRAKSLAPLAGMTGGHVVGIDISLEELTFARKLLAKERIEATLVAGCAEALPFADGVFSFIYSPDVIEHVRSQPDYFREACRTLQPHAAILLNSPNRFCVAGSLSRVPAMTRWQLETRVSLVMGLNPTSHDTS